MKNTEDIIQRIQKLLKLSESPNENEAIAAMQKANELLTKHNLSLGDVEINQSTFVKESVLSYKRLTTWQSQLIGAVAGFNFCIAYSWISSNSKTIILYGRRNNVITAKYQLEYLSDAVLSLAKKDSRLVGTSQKNSFRIGCATRIGNRMRELLELQKQNGINSNEVTVSALAVRSLHQKMEDEKKQMQEELGYFPTRKPGSFSDREAFEAGMLAGDSVSLNKQLA